MEQKKWPSFQSEEGETRSDRKITPPTRLGRRSRPTLPDALPLARYSRSAPMARDEARWEPRRPGSSGVRQASDWDFWGGGGRSSLPDALPLARYSRSAPMARDEARCRSERSSARVQGVHPPLVAREHKGIESELLSPADGLAGERPPVARRSLTRLAGVQRRDLARRSRSLLQRLGFTSACMHIIELD